MSDTPQYYLVVNGVAVGPREINPRDVIKAEVERHFPNVKSITLIENGEIKNAVRADQSAEQQDIAPGSVLFVIQNV